MKIFRTFFRSVRDAFKSVFRNFSLSLASISCISITLIIVVFSLLLSDNVKNFTREIEGDVTIVVFLDSDVDVDGRVEFEKRLKEIANVDHFDYKSKADVKADISESEKELRPILEEWNDEDNPLKDTYMIKVKDVNDIGATAKEIEGLDGVSLVQYGEGLVEKLIDVFDAIEKVTIVAAIGLTLVTIFLIINTIKLTIFSRKREISIMRLVGASNSRIKFPFVIEGIVLGIIGSIIPILAIVFGYTAIYNHFGGQLFSPVIKLVNPMPFVVYASVIVLGIGVIVGMLGSANAVRRYVKI